VQLAGRFFMRCAVQRRPGPPNRAAWGGLFMFVKKTVQRLAVLAKSFCPYLNPKVCPNDQKEMPLLFFQH